MRPQLSRSTRLCLTTATAAVALAFVWQCLIVRYNYRGDWTGLFCIGESSRLPPALAATNPYRFRHSPGYDGQFYFFIAHDPSPRGETVGYVDNPPLRWRRILVPATARFLAFGDARRVTATYIAVVLGCVFVGAWWLSRFCAAAGRSPLSGLAFLLIPAVAVSLDRMTIDVALAALCAGFAVYGVAAPSRKIYLVLALAPFARETGLVVIAAFALFCALGKRFKETALGLAMAIPWLYWSLYLGAVLWADATPWTTAIPFTGVVARLRHPLQYPVTTSWVAAAAVLDYVAFLGICLAFVIAARFIWKRSLGLLELVTVIHSLVAAFLVKPDVWADAYAFARTMTPMLLGPALIGLWTRSWWMFLPLGLTVPRIALQIATVSFPILKGLLGAPALLQ